MSIARWAPLLVLAGGGIVLGFEQERTSAWLSRHDLLAHAIGLGLLAFALRRAFPRWPLRRIALACAAAAVGLEALQAFVPGRTASWRDVGAGLAGLAPAVALLGARSLRARRQEFDQE